MNAQATRGSCLGGEEEWKCSEKGTERAAVRHKEEDEGLGET